MQERAAVSVGTDNRFRIQIGEHHCQPGRRLLPRTICGSKLALGDETPGFPCEEQATRGVC
jgi:hypothetical protein